MADLRVVTAASPQAYVRRAPTTAQRQAGHLEALGLAAAALVVLFGGWLAYRQHAPAIDAAAREIAEGRAVDLNQAADARALAPVLDLLREGTDRDAAARAILQARASGGPFTHVGALARIRRDGETAPLFNSAAITAIKPAAVVRSASAYRSLVARAALLFFAAFLVAHLVRRAGGVTGDPVLLPAVMLLTGLSAIAMMSMRDPLRDTDAAGSLVMGVVLGCAALIALAFVDFEDPRFKRTTVLPAAVAVGLASLLLLFGSGPGTSGAKVNLLGVQPIELIRLLAVVALASYFSRRWQMLREISTPAGPVPAVRKRVSLPRLRDVKPLAVIVGTLLVFFVLQKDLGPALVLGSIALGLYGVARGRAGLVIAGFAALVVGFAAGHALGIPSTVARRVSIWLDPWHNALIGGDQIAHAQWALASGGAWGIGGGLGEGQLIPAGHTDLIAAVLGEELGFIGLLAIAAIFAIVIWRILRIAERAPGDYTAFLALGCALALAVPAFVIVGGLLGLIPLSGVVTPFLSYGKSAMIGNLAALAIPLAIANRAGRRRPAFAKQIRTIRVVLFAGLAIIAGRAAWLQIVRADEVTLKPSLVRQADGGARYQYNPRLMLAARMIPRGTIFDRNGLALASSDPSASAPMLKRLAALGAGGAACAPPTRCYPLGAVAFHLIGDAARQTNWAARNTSFAERDAAPMLQGFDDRAKPVQLTLANGETVTVLAHDYTELLPLVRSRGFLDHPDVRGLLDRNRDVRLTIDGPLQALVARALEARARGAESWRGAAVVIDVSTGAILASASYPWPGMTATGDVAEAATPDQLLDRARYGLYPPGSTFKLITAAAALSGPRPDLLPSFQCERLADGRVGAHVHGVGRPIRDDVLDREPHGRVDLRRGLVVSCNAYFAQLAMHIGPDAIATASSAAGIQAASAPAGANLRRTLPFAGYGQGEVLASPLRMARAVAAIAGGGSILESPIVHAADRKPASTAWLAPANAATLRSAMREVVQSGTGRALAGHPVPIAGKTGTAEVTGAASHSWFVGFAPAGSEGTRIAFAVVVENAGYGGRAAATVAGDIVTAAKLAGVIR